jgi:hypothetical protein
MKKLRNEAKRRRKEMRSKTGQNRMKMKKNKEERIVNEDGEERFNQ